MQLNRKQWNSAVALAAAIVCASGSAYAQSLVQSAGNVVAHNGDAVPGVSGAVFGGSSTFDSAILDENGRLFFRGRMTGGGAVTTTDRAYFTGTTRSDLALVIRSGDPAPGLVGLTLNTASSQGLGGSPRLAPSGEMFWGCSLSSGVGTDDTAIYVGTPGNFSVLVREGDPAVGTVGAVYSTGFNGISQQPSGYNRNGVVLFRSSLSGGDVVGTTNNEAWYTGTLGSLTLMQRKGDVVLGGAVIGSLGFISQINDAGQVIHDETLSQTLGTTPATAATDSTLWLWTPSSGNTLLVREGDPVPGTVGATFNTSTNTWSPGVAACAFNSSGEALMSASMLNGDTVPGVNDTGLFKVSASGTTLLVRRGDACPGLPGVTFNAFHVSYNALNNSGVIAFKAQLAGASVTTADDTSLWIGTPGNFTLVAREGDAAVGTVGATLAEFMGLGSFHLSALGQVAFRTDLTGGDTVPFTNSGALYAWDPATGMHLVARTNDSVEVQPGVFKTFFSFGNIQFNNGDCSPLSWNTSGRMVLNLTHNDSTATVITVDIPTTPEPVNYCTAGTSSNGCVASISASANPSATMANACNLSVSNVDGLRNGILFYGLAQHSASWCTGGSSFLCVKAPTQRTGTQDSGGTLGACDGSFALDWNAFQASNPGALGNPWTAGTIVDVQAWYRDPPSCKTTSLSDAVELTYLP